MVSKPGKHKPMIGSNKNMKPKKISQEEQNKRRYLRIWNDVGLNQVDFEVLWRDNNNRVILISIIERLKFRLDDMYVRLCSLEVLYSGVPDVNKAGPWIKQNFQKLYDARQKELKEKAGKSEGGIILNSKGGK